MAGDWIKVRKCLFVHPKVIRIAEATAMGEEEVVGWLMKLWSWADDATEDGNVASVTPRALARVTGAPQHLLAAVEDVGWMLVSDSGIEFPNYEEHMGNSAKRRCLTSKRVKRHRNATSVTKSLPEKRREEKRIIPPKVPLGGRPPGADADLPFSSPEFLEAWSDWCHHRVEIRKKLTPTSVKQQLRQLRDWGEVKSIRVIRYTIEKGWQGLREPEGPRGMPADSEAAKAEARKVERLERHRRQAAAEQAARLERESESSRKNQLDQFLAAEAKNGKAAQ